MTTVSTGVSTGPNLQATRIIFPEPRRVELEQLEVSLEALGPHEVVVRGRRSVISPGTELAHYRGDAFAGVLPHAQARGALPRLRHGGDSPGRRRGKRRD